MNLDSPHTWQWIWIVFAVIFIAGELSAPATFFFLPFAIGAGVAAAMCFGGISVGIAWATFLVVSVVAFAGLWKVGRRLERADSEQESVGSTRFLGAEAMVVEDIETNGLGMVRLEREQWRAQSLTGAPIRKGSTVVVTKLAGVALIVVPVDEPEDLLVNYPEIDPGGSGEPVRGANEQ